MMEAHFLLDQDCYENHVHLHEAVRCAHLFQLLREEQAGPAPLQHKNIDQCLCILQQGVSFGTPTCA